LSNNREMALQCLMSLKRQLSKNPTLKERYVDTIETYLFEDYAAVAQPAREDSTVWFLPHHPVLNPKKPEKLRVVFDCAVRFKGKCLNDVLMQGPNLTNELVGILIRFRKEPVAVFGGIRLCFIRYMSIPRMWMQ